MAQAPNGLILPPHRMTIESPQALQMLVDSDPHVKVIRWSTGVGLAAGSACQESSGLSPLEWIGRQMDEALGGGRRTWIPEEWQRFSNALLNHGHIRAFEYRAFLYTGEEVEMVVDANLADCGGLARVVRTLSCRPI